MIRLIDLTKRFTTVTAVNNINLEVRPGEIFGFLGPNGAGKTTTIKMMVGLLKPTSGRILLDEIDVAADPLTAKAIVGFIPDRPFIYSKLTGREFLQFIAGLYGIRDGQWKERAQNLFKLFELEDWADELVESYSHGMRQRLIMSAALIHRPKIIIVDEPMVGLDPKGARLVKQLFKEVSSQGTTVFMSTHTLEVAEEMCDRIAIINLGEIIACGTMAELRTLSDSTEKLETIFLKLTGGEEMADIINVMGD